MQTFSTTARSRMTVRDQIYQQLRGAIVEGRMRPGDRLPSVRSLSTDFGVARGTVLAALHRLAGEGYVAASGSAGTRVTFRKETSLQEDEAAAMRQSIDEPVSDSPSLQPGIPALEEFPRKLWSRLVGQEARRSTPRNLNYPEPAGEPGLKRAIASYLQVSRGVVCEPDQIIVTNCFQGSQHFIRQLVLREGDAAWVEDPGYRPVRKLLLATRIRPIPVPVDERGLDVNAAMRHAPGARAAFVSPTFQFPMGVRMTVERREALLAWATSARAWIVEDDYDGEYQYGDKSSPALKNLDRDDRVLFCGTFSKVLFPALRIAYIVVPRSLVTQAARLADILFPAPAPLLQNALTNFMLEGHFGRHVSKMRRVYQTRRQFLLNSVEDYFSAAQRTSPLPSGMHIILRLSVRDELVIQRVPESGLMPLALSTMFIQVPPIQGLVLGFASVTSQAHADGLIGQLAVIVKSIDRQEFAFLE